MKASKKFSSLIMIEPQTKEIRGQIKSFMGQICQYQVKKSFNHPIYLHMILIISPFVKKLFSLQGFLREYDPHAMTMGVRISGNIDALLVSDALVIGTSTLAKSHTLGFSPPKQRTPTSTHDVVDAKHDQITQSQFEVRFLGSSHVSGKRTLPIAFFCR